MPSPEDIEAQEKQLQSLRRTLAHNLEQKAKLSSAYLPPATSGGIHEAREGIRKIKDTLRSWGISVENLPDDTDSGSETTSSDPTVKRPIYPKTFFEVRDNSSKVAIVIPGFPVEDLRNRIREIIDELKKLQVSDTKPESNHLEITSKGDSEKYGSRNLLVRIWCTYLKKSKSSERNKKYILNRLEDLLVGNFGVDTGTIKILADLHSSALAEADVQTFANIRELLSGSLSPENQPELILGSHHTISNENSFNDETSDKSVIIAIGLFSNEISMNIKSRTKISENKLPFRLVLKGDKFMGDFVNENTIFFLKPGLNEFDKCQKKGNFSGDIDDYALVVRVRGHDEKSYLIIGGISPQGTEAIGNYINKHWKKFISQIFSDDNFDSNRENIAESSEFAVLFSIHLGSNAKPIFQIKYRSKIS